MKTLTAEHLPIGQHALRELFDKMGDAIVVVDGEGMILYANFAAAELLRSEDEPELKGQPFGFPLVSGGSTEIDLINAKGEHVVAEMRVVTTDWGEDPVSLAIIRDLTERHRLVEERVERERLEAERLLLASELSRLEVLARANEALNQTLYLDESVCDFLEEITGRIVDAAGVALTVADDDSRDWFFSNELSEDQWKGLLGSLRDRAGEWRHDDQSEQPTLSQERFATSLVLPIRSRNEVIGVFVALSCGDELPENDRRLVYNLRDSLQSAVDRFLIHRKTEEESALRDRFFAKTSHEIRNAVQALGGWSQILDELLDLEGDAREGLRAISNNTQLLGRLARDMVEVSQMLSGQMTMSMSVIDLADVVTNSVAAMNPAAEKAGVSLVSEKIGSGHLVEGDDGRLQQVFQNLIGNALRYTPEGGTVRVWMERDPYLVRVMVEDDGEGISAEEAESLFEAFQQGASGKGRRGGLGLGLTIGKEIVNRHNGVLTFTSAGVGRGSTFIVELPLAQFSGRDGSVS